MRVLFLESMPLWTTGLPRGFRDAGHQVRIAGTLSREMLPAILGAFRPHLIITLGWSSERRFLKRKGGEQLKASGIPHVYWATEDPTHTERFSLPYVTGVQPDFVFTICRARVPFYLERGFPAAHMDFGFHHSVHRPVAPSRRYRSRVAVVANAYPHILERYPDHYRAQSMATLLAPLVQGGVEVAFHGREWERMGPVLGAEIPEKGLRGLVSATASNQVYNAADVVMGLQNQRAQVTQRTYEVLAAGGVLLTSDTEAVRELFVPGRDLVTSASPEETIRLVRLLLDDAGMRAEIREQGQRAVAVHSYRHRAEFMVDTLREHGVL